MTLLKTQNVCFNENKTHAVLNVLRLIHSDQICYPLNCKCLVLNTHFVVSKVIDTSSWALVA